MKLKRGGMVCFRMIFGSKSPPVILFSTRNSHWYTLFPLKTTYSKGVSHCQISGGYTVYPLRKQTYCGYKTHKTWLVLTYQWYSQWFCWCWWLVRTGDDGVEITLLQKPNILSNFAWTFPVLLVCCKSIPPATPKVLTHNSGHRFWVGSHVPEAWHGVVS